MFNDEEFDYEENYGIDDEYVDDYVDESVYESEDDDDLYYEESAHTDEDDSDLEQDDGFGEGKFYPEPYVGDGMEAEAYAVGKVDKDPDASLSRAIDINKGSFSVSMGTISIKDIVIPQLVKESRKETYLGLTRSIEELGCLVPIHVLITEGYAEYVEETGSSDGYEGPKYVLLDGIRRIFALMKNGIQRVNAIIYDFEDKEKGSDMVNILSMILNKVQRKSWSEIWYMYQVLESQSFLSPGNIEFLLQLEPGDAMKLKEVMTRRSDFPEPADDLLDKKKTLQQAYNMLIKAMKEQDLLAKEDISGVSDMEETEGIVSSTDGDKLSDQEVKEILDMEDKFDGELSDDDFDELMGNNVPDDRQEVGNRHPLDPALRAAVLQRDGYCCQITGRGKGLPTPIALSILNVHHKIPVHCGGTDTMDNLITICLDAHTLVHVIERNNGKLGMSKEQYESLSDEDKNFITGVMKIARIAVEANRRQGRSREQIYKDTASSVRFQMPGKVQRENMDALAQAKSKG